MTAVTKLRAITSITLTTFDSGFARLPVPEVPASDVGYDGLRDSAMANTSSRPLAVNEFWQAGDIPTERFTSALFARRIPARSVDAAS